MKHWETKYTGKGLNLAIFTIFSILATIAWVLYGSRKDHDRTIEDLLYSFLAFSPLLIAWILVFSKFIFKKRIPKEIIHDSKDNVIIFKYANGKKNTLGITDFSFSFFHHKRYSVLAIQKKLNSKKGHIVRKELMSFVGQNHKFGWTKKQLINITDYFEKIGIENYKTKDKSFIMRIIE